jgi:tripartite-type tricarboxylate transporter receptor subunit TctC
MVRCAAGLKCTVDPLRDLTAITPIGDAPTAVFVSSSLPIQSFRELLEYAKANPNKLSYGTSGIASKSHLAAEAIQRAGAVRLVHVPYKVGNQALLDVMAGQLPVSLSISDLALPHLRAGKVKALAVLDARTQLLPGVPAVAEVIPGFIAPPSWAGFSGPANLPPPVLKRLADALTRAIKSPEATAKLNATGWEAWGHPPEEYTAMIRRDLELVARIIREAGIRIED